MFNFEAINGMRQKGWQHPQTQIVRPEAGIKGDNTAVEPKT
jgi:hypothetical protein